STCWRTPLFRAFFFCQAEDGIRDRNVTGVQTCALPILKKMLASKKLYHQWLEHFIKSHLLKAIHMLQLVIKLKKNQLSVSLKQRSEERRVGKECRRRWGAGRREMRGE